MSVTTAAEFQAWKTAQGAYSTWTGKLRDMYKALFKTLPEEERYLAQCLGKNKYFVEENRGESRESLSPSGKYKLVLTPYTTSKGSWSYTRGEVFRTSDGERVADVKRNYSSFFHLWMEEHVDGHDWLVCGEDYQGQTFCELDTGRVKSHIPDAAFDGHGFCWTDCELLADGKTLKVDGCYWACPYETRLYDVTNPMSGWPALQYDGNDISFSNDDEKSSLEFKDGVATWELVSRAFKDTGESESDYEVRSHEAFKVWSAAKRAEASEEVIQAAWDAYAKIEEEVPEEDEDSVWDTTPEHRIVLRREEGSLNLTLVEDWKSETLLEWERGYAEASEKRKANRREWKEGDVLLKVFEELTDLDGLVGFTYPSGNMRADGDKNPAYLTLKGRKYDENRNHNHWSSIEWGVVEGPLKVRLNIRGKSAIKHEFERSPEGAHEAWSTVQAHLAAEEGL